MSIVRVTENPEGRTGSINSIGGNNWNRAFMVQTSVRTDDQVVVATAIDPGGTGGLSAVATLGTRIPRVRERHPTDRFATVRRITPTQRPDSGGTLWDVVVEYSSAAEAIEFGDDPLARPKVVTWGDVATTEEYRWDADGTEVKDTAGAPFEPGLVRDFTRPVATIQLNAATYSPREAHAFYDNVNSKSFGLGGVNIPPGWAKIKSWTGTPTKEADTSFWITRVVLHLKRLVDIAGLPKISGWDQRVESRGFSEIIRNGDDSEVVSIKRPVFKTNADGSLFKDPATGKTEQVGLEQAQDPTALDVSGKAIPGKPPHVLTFRPYPKSDFTGFAWTD